MSRHLSSCHHWKEGVRLANRRKFEESLNISVEAMTPFDNAESNDRFMSKCKIKKEQSTECENRVTITTFYSPLSMMQCAISILGIPITIKRRRRKSDPIVGLLSNDLSGYILTKVFA
ncbi:hypothetical protein NPIL_184861 [Nephila pilipes]|uniref:Uncharacterized protein n=1 Tax=Nephila pilipes TaxID=299642 RepID=A0A8X6PLD7_NEPPI|nr:hypothetical protein NPIL_184861 [Nephila pilipes]